MSKKKIKSDFVDSLCEKGNYIRMPRKLTTLLGGCEEAVFLCDLISLYDYYAGKKRLKDGRWFFSTLENMQDRISISRYKQRMIIKKLETLGLLSTKEKYGRRYFSIHMDRILVLLEHTPSESDTPDEIDRGIESLPNEIDRGADLPPIEINGGTHTEIDTPKNTIYEDQSSYRENQKLSKENLSLLRNEGTCPPNGGQDSLSLIHDSGNDSPRIAENVLEHKKDEQMPSNDNSVKDNLEPKCIPDIENEIEAAIRNYISDKQGPGNNLTSANESFESVRHGGDSDEKNINEEWLLNLQFENSHFGRA